MYAAVEGDGEAKPNELGKRGFVFVITCDWLWEERFTLSSLEQERQAYKGKQAYTYSLNTVIKTDTPSLKV